MHIVEDISSDPRLPVIDIERKTIRKQLFDAFKTQIINAVWLPHTKIPSENELARSLGVSRLAVREVIQQFIGLGLLETRQGDGTYLKEVSARTYIEQMLPLILLEKTSSVEILEYRYIVEVGAAALVIGRANIKDLAKIKKILAKLEEVDSDSRQISQEELAFHVAFASATGNPVIERLARVINELLAKISVELVELLGLDVIRDHYKKLVAALEEKNLYNAQESLTDYYAVVRNAMEKQVSFSNKKVSR